MAGNSPRLAARFAAFSSKFFLDHAGCHRERLQVSVDTSSFLVWVHVSLPYTKGQRKIN
jgi:hypothetical protein